VSLVLLFLLPAAIFGGLVAYGHFERSTAATPQQGTPGSLVWGEGKVIFSNKAQLAAWLRLHGSSYRAFVKRHPEALRLVSPQPRKHTAATKSTKHVAAARPLKHPVKHAKPVAKPKPVARPKPVAKTFTVTTPVASRAPANASTGGGARTLVFGIAAALGLLVGAFALMPPALLWRFGVRKLPEPQLRFSAAAVSVAILAGVLFGTLVG
jgi:hypothetical protein